jgi:AcrR family transcriptional regulator
MQTKKEEMRGRIRVAALKQFAERGFAHTKMSDIAKEARVSVGNIYRYFMNKDDLFYTLITPAMYQKFKNFIDEMFRSAQGTRLKDAEKFRQLVKEYVHFLAQYRLQTIIVGEGCQGTLYENLKEEVIELRQQHLQDYLRTLPGKEHICLNEEQKFLLQVIYYNLMQGIIKIFKRYETPEEIEPALRNFLSYHFFGLDTLVSNIEPGE